MDLRLGPYLELLASFLDGSIGVSDFAGAYLDLFKHDDVIRPDDVFDVLDELFSDIDAYSPQPAEDEIDEEQLRRSASEAYHQLRAYAQDDPSIGRPPVAVSTTYEQCAGHRLRRSGHLVTG
jgi:hypothetical protein